MTIKELNQLLTDIKYKDSKLPEHARVPKNFSERGATNIEKAICAFLKSQGHQAEQIKNKGTWVDESYEYVNVMGQTKRAGTGKFVKGSGTNGTADLSASIKPYKFKFAVSVKIEVKWNNDPWREDQKKYCKAIQDAGGVYVIARDFQQWHENFYLPFMDSEP